MKVYVTTKAKPFKPEMFIDVYGSRKGAEKALRAEFPYMRRSFGDFEDYISDKDCTWLLFIHEKEVKA